MPHNDDGRPGRPPLRIEGRLLVVSDATEPPGGLLLTFDGDSHGRFQAYIPCGARVWVNGERRGVAESLALARECQASGHAVAVTLFAGPGGDEFRVSRVPRVVRLTPAEARVVAVQAEAAAVPPGLVADWRPDLAAAAGAELPADGVPVRGPTGRVVGRAFPVPGKPGLASVMVHPDDVPEFVKRGIADAWADAGATTPDGTAFVGVPAGPDGGADVPHVVGEPGRG